MSTLTRDGADASGQGRTAKAGLTALRNMFIGFVVFTAFVLIAAFLLAQPVHAQGKGELPIGAPRPAGQVAVLNAQH